MNILFLTTHINSGGITTYIKTLTRGLIDKKHKVVIVSGGGDTEKEFSSLGGRVENLNIKTKSELSPKIYLALGDVQKIIDREKIQIIHANTRVTQVMGQLLARKKTLPFVATCHGFFKKRISRRVFPCWGDKVIAISQAVYKHLESDFDVANEKIALVPSGVEIKDFPLVEEGKKKLLKKEYRLENNLVIGMIARLSEVKGQDILIQAMTKIVRTLPNVKLLLVGEGRTERELKRLVHSFHLKDYVLFFPVVNKTIQFLSLMDVFVMPSRQEGLGLSIMEAQAAGLPVVASNVGGIPSLIEDGKTGFLVEPLNPEGFADRIIYLLKNPLQAKQIGLEARKFIEQNYSAETMVEKTLKVYQGLVPS